MNVVSQMKILVDHANQEELELESTEAVCSAVMQIVRVY